MKVVIGRTTLLIIPVLVISASSFLWPQVARAKPPIPATPDYNCVVAGHPWAPVYQDLKGIGLFVEVLPNRYMEAVACHGRENQCADNAGVVSDKPDQRPVFIKQWTDDYNAYPPSLHYDNLVRVFTDGINATLQPFVMPENCKRPPIAVQGMNDLWLPPGRAANKDVLTIVVRLQIFDSMKPRMAVLSTDLYRPDELHSDFRSQAISGHVMPISLDWPDDVIAAKVSQLAKSFAISTQESVQP